MLSQAISVFNITVIIQLNTYILFVLVYGSLHWLFRYLVHIYTLCYIFVFKIHFVPCHIYLKEYSWNLLSLVILCLCVDNLFGVIKVGNMLWIANDRFYMYCYISVTTYIVMVRFDCMLNIILAELYSCIFVQSELTAWVLYWPMHALYVD